MQILDRTFRTTGRLPEEPRPDYPLHLVRKVERPGIGLDLYCANCNHRLEFLLYRSRVTAQNAA